MADEWSRIPYKTRQHIKQVLLARDGLTCCVCGTRILSPRAATIEHKRERSAGGSLLDYRNLGLAHRDCNYRRLGSRRGRVALVSAASWFAPSDAPRFSEHEGPEHPAPPVFPSPGRSEKTEDDKAR